MPSCASPDRRRIYAVATVLAVLAAGCGSTGSPAQPTRPATATDAASAPFSVDLPIRPEDSVSLAYGLWPFGVHGSAHAVDGHPGYDFEFRPGTSIVAAAEGVVDNAIVDTFDPTKTSLQLRHHGARGDYFTSYSNLASVPAELRTKGAAVARGQVIGAGGVFFGGTSGMTHFGVYEPPSVDNPAGGAVSPAAYMTASARAALDAIWRTAVYNTEWCEPFLTNSRASGFPLQRLWTRQTGELAPEITVRCPADGAPVEYALADGSGGLETGTLRFSGTPAVMVDFLPEHGTPRLGWFDIVDGKLTLSLGAAGSGRPARLINPSVYATF